MAETLDQIQRPDSVFAWVCPALDRCVNSVRNCRIPRLPSNNNMESGVPGKIIEQFVERVTDFSSQYGAAASISYTVPNLAGEPQVYPKYGDFTQAAVFVSYFSSCGLLIIN